MADAILAFGGGGASAEGIIVSATAPEDTACLWIDTSDNGIAKYYNGTEWTSVIVAWQ